MVHSGTGLAMHIRPQIVICSTEVPQTLQECRESVIKWSEANNYELLEVRPPNYINEFKYITSAFDLLRIELLAERPYRLWVDWDVELHDDFHIDYSYTKIALDYILWNGSNTEWFKKVLNDYTNYCNWHTTAYEERYRMYKIMRKNGLGEFPNFSRKQFKHIYYSSGRKNEN